MNKSLIPIKLKNSDVKETDWNFRSKVIDIHDEKQVIELEEKMRAWLGLAIEFIDLGLPSGTLWKYKNEVGFYDYDAAARSFGIKLPTKEQFEELKKSCQWMWTGSGYKVVGTNGASIVLPATGYLHFDGLMCHVGSYGSYWSSTPYGSDYAWCLNFNLGGMRIDDDFRNYGQTVRLVKD